MKPLPWLAALGVALCVIPSTLAAEPDDAKKYQPKIDKGLKWLAERQEKNGRWEETGGGKAVQTTALAGLALLAEGSTLKEGKYAEQLRKAADWVEGWADEDGRFFDPNDRASKTEYLAGHGYAMLFLSQVYAKEA